MLSYYLYYILVFFRTFYLLFISGSVHICPSEAQGHSKVLKLIEPSVRALILPHLLLMMIVMMLFAFCCPSLLPRLRSCSVWVFLHSSSFFFFFFFLTLWFHVASATPRDKQQAEIKARRRERERGAKKGQRVSVEADKSLKIQLVLGIRRKRAPPGNIVGRYPRTECVNNTFTCLFIDRSPC